LPFTPGYDLVGVVEGTGPGVPLSSSSDSWLLISVSSVDTHSMRSAPRLLLCRPPMASIPPRRCASRWPISPPAKCSPAIVLGASGTVGTALLDLTRHLGQKAIGTCSATNVATVERYGATAIDYRARDFVAVVRELTAGRKGGVGVDAAFDAIGGAHFARSFACLAPAAYSCADNGRWRRRLGVRIVGLGRLKLWDVLSGLFWRPSRDAGQAVRF
jgi:NADPH:quinone reductase-like Zn-dependent oxidoreductase